MAQNTWWWSWVLLAACAPLASEGLEPSTPDVAEGELAQTVSPAADLYVRSGEPSRNFGAATYVVVDAATSASDDIYGYMRFTVPSFGGSARARLRLYVTTATVKGPDIIKLGNTAWSESTTTWSNKPATSGTVIASIGNAPAGWLEVDLSGAVVSGQVLSLAFKPRSTERLVFNSKEAARNGPKLVLTLDSSAPSAPGAVTATALSSSAIEVTWSPSTDDVGVTDYKVFRAIGSGTLAYLTTLAGSVTSFSDTDLAASTAYSYRVRALDAAGNVSSLSAAATASTPGEIDTTAPSVPQRLDATPLSPTSVRLTSPGRPRATPRGSRATRSIVLPARAHRSTSRPSRGLPFRMAV
jgi:hypothetical protein